MPDITKMSLAAGRKAKLGKISDKEARILEHKLIDAAAKGKLKSSSGDNKPETIGKQTKLNVQKKGNKQSVSMALLSEFVEGDPLSATEMKVSGRELEELPDLSVCSALKRLDLSSNKFQSIDFLSNCRDITWLSIKDNQVQDISPLKRMWHLQMLNIGNNKVDMLDSLAKMSELKAFIANNNTIRSFEGLGLLTNLSTIVLSHNAIMEIAGIKSLRALTKLSVAHNQIRVIPDLSAHPLLEELRLNDNKIMRIPDTIDRNPELRLVDLGRNRLFDPADVPKLARCRKLSNVNLLGNTRLCEHVDYRAKALAAMPQLVVLDGRRVDESKAPKKKKAPLDPSRSRKERPATDPGGEAPQPASDPEAGAAQRKGPAAGRERPPPGSAHAAAKADPNPATSDHNSFVKEEIARLRREDPGLDHKAAFRLAALAWAKAHPKPAADAQGADGAPADRRRPAVKGDSSAARPAKRKAEADEGHEVGGGGAEESPAAEGAEGGEEPPARKKKKSKQLTAVVDESDGDSGSGAQGKKRGGGKEAAGRKRKVVEVRDGWEAPAADAAGRSGGKAKGGRADRRDSDGEASGRGDGSDDDGFMAAAAGKTRAAADEPDAGLPAAPKSSGLVSVRELAGAGGASKQGGKGGKGKGDLPVPVLQAAQVGLGGESAWD